MTTPADIDAIRERADKAHSWVYFDIGTETDANTLIDAFATVHADIVALLAHVDALAERVRTLEAALRPFAALLPRYEEYVAEKQAEGVNRRHMLDFTEWLNLYGQDPDILSGQCRRAADALAANADAGNGGA